MICSEMCVLSLVYIYVAACWFCTVCCPLLFASTCHFLITRLMFLNILFMFVLYFVYSVFFVLFCVLFHLVCIAVSFVFLYKSTDSYHRVETQLQ